MKKGFKIGCLSILGFVVLIFIIAAIVGTTTTEVTTPEPSPATETVTKVPVDEEAIEEEAKELEEETKKADEEAKKADEEAKLKADKEAAIQAEDVAYTDMMGPKFTDFSKVLNDFGTQAGKIGNDPMLMFDSDWKLEMGMIVGRMGIQITDMREAGPVPAGMKEIDDKILEALDEYQFVVDNFPRAVDTLDADLIDQSTSKMQAGTQKIKEARVLLDEKKSN